VHAMSCPTVKRALISCLARLAGRVRLLCVSHSTDSPVEARQRHQHLRLRSARPQRSQRGGHARILPLPTVLRAQGASVGRTRTRGAAIPTCTQTAWGCSRCKVNICSELCFRAFDHVHCCRRRELVVQYARVATDSVVGPAVEPVPTPPTRPAQARAGSAPPSARRGRSGGGGAEGLAEGVGVGAARGGKHGGRPRGSYM
jgi:hypothetical protein